MKYIQRAGGSRTRLVVAGTVVGLALGLMPGIGSAAADEDTTEPEAPTASHVRVASYNASVHTGVEENRRDVAAIIDGGSDIIALQEMSSWKKRQSIQSAFLDCAECTFDGWIPVRAVPGGLPILWRSDQFDLVEKGLRQVTDDTYVGPRGAGPKVMRARWITWAHLRDRDSGRHVFVLNTHGVPTVQTSSGRPNWKLRKRVLLYREHMRGLRHFIQEIQARPGGAILVTGDFNVNFRKDRQVQPKVFPYHQMETVNIRASHRDLGMTSRGTHVLPNGFDRRLIDYVHSMRRAFIKPVRQRVRLHLASDHRPMIVDYELYGKDCLEGRKILC